MARPQDFWIALRNQFDPQEVLAGPRGQNLHVDLTKDLEGLVKATFQPEATLGHLPRVLLTGHRGAG